MRKIARKKGKMTKKGRESGKKEKSVKIWKRGNVKKKIRGG